MALDACDDLYRSAATGAGFDVYIEHSLEPLRPGYCGMTLG